MRRLWLVGIGIITVILWMLINQSDFLASLILDESSTARIPPSIQVEDGTYNLQIQAVEVTQGVRGDIPTRIAPNGDLTLLPDGAVHVANRRTIVRVYPWVEDHSDTTLPPVTAQLWAYRDGNLLPGSPISPQNKLLSNISKDWDLATMRGDASKSWNFVLPSDWITSGTEAGSFSLRLVVEVNPIGPDHQPECPGCDVDNQVILGEQAFVTVPALVIQPYIVEHTLTDLKNDQVSYSGPTREQLDSILREVHCMLPVGDLSHGLDILPPINVEWQGALHDGENHVFAEAMIKEYLPGSVLRDRQDNLIHVFLFSDASNHDFLTYNNSGGIWLGLAWTGRPYAQSAARARDLIHELTHAIGLSHAGSMNGETNTNADYPDPSGRIESNAYGFDIWEMQAIPPVSEAGETFDYMSYDKEHSFWVSIYTWQAIGELLGRSGLDV